MAKLKSAVTDGGSPKQKPDKDERPTIDNSPKGSALFADQDDKPRGEGGSRSSARQSTKATPSEIAAEFADHCAADSKDGDADEDIAERGFIYRTTSSAAMAHYDITDLVITDQILRLAVDAAESWANLVDELKNRSTK
jgi:hypothetical protein